MLKRLVVAAFVLLVAATTSGFTLCTPKNNSKECSWTKTDTALEVAFQGVTLLDWNQTLRGHDTMKPLTTTVYYNGVPHTTTLWNTMVPAYEENNPLLGRHPSRARINVTIAAAMIGHAAVARLLPQPYRRYWQAVFITIEVGAVTHNVRAGLGLHLTF